MPGPDRIDAMVARSATRLERMHTAQVHRGKWPDFAAFDRARYPEALRHAAAVQWAGRARAEHGSIQQFAELGHALSILRVPVHVHGALARLQTDEARHVELCARMALACQPSLEQQAARWPRPAPPWMPWPREGDDEAITTWACEAVLVACCLGETLSVPMLDALAEVSTEPLAEAVCAQILRDEHFHAQFGWEVLSLLLARLEHESSRAHVQKRLGRALAGFETSVCGSLRAADLAGQEVTITRGAPNLGTLNERQYAAIFYATVEGEIFGELTARGLDPHRAWAERGVRLDGPERPPGRT